MALIWLPWVWNHLVSLLTTTLVKSDQFIGFRVNVNFGNFILIQTGVSLCGVRILLLYLCFISLLMFISKIKINKQLKDLTVVNR